MSALLHVEGLSKRFGGLAVNRAVFLDIAAGERLALIGPNGAGKTTFVDLITGHAKPDAGRILFDAKDVTRLDPVRRARLGLVRTFQAMRLFPDLTPQDHAILAILQREGRAMRILARFRGDSAVNDEADAVLSWLGLSDIARRPVRALAHGQRRLIEIVVAICLAPRLLILDEPTAGLPSGETRLIEAALERLPPGLAVLMIEHDVDLVFRFAYRIAVLAAGEIIFDGPPGEAAADERVRDAYLGHHGHGRFIA